MFSFPPGQAVVRPLSLIGVRTSPDPDPIPHWSGQGFCLGGLVPVSQTDSTRAAGALCQDRETRPKTQSSTVSRRASRVGRNSAVSWDTLDTQLTWMAHVDQVEKKAAQRLGVFGPLLNRKSGLSVRNGVLLCKQLIRHMMDYACPIWRSASRSHGNCKW
jgi:hypothetical protein